MYQRFDETRCLPFQDMIQGLTSQNTTIYETRQAFVYGKAPPLALQIASEKNSGRIPVSSKKHLENKKIETPLP